MLLHPRDLNPLFVLARCACALLLLGGLGGVAATGLLVAHYVAGDAITP